MSECCGELKGQIKRPHGRARTALVCLSATLRGSAVVWLALVGQAFGAERPLIAARPEEAGPDFTIQGEYHGLISGGYRKRPVGVQIVALGDGAFQAVEYEGGLPGAGWDGRTRRVCQGQRRGSVSIFSGEDTAISILNGRLTLSNGVGGLRGTLSPTQRHSPTEGLAPPPGAVVLFDGSPPYELNGARLTEDNLLMEGCITQRSFNDFRLHVEFRTPFMPAGVDQGRGNSGVYIQERYELQVLDSFGLSGAANECGGLYKQRPPDVNMCLPPLAWQTYDIQFRAARFDGAGKKTQPALLTVRHNGVLIHNRVEIAGKTGNGKPEGPEPRPILFQNHKDPVRFRNLWIVPEDERYDGGDTDGGETIEYVQPLEVLRRQPAPRLDADGPQLTMRGRRAQDDSRRPLQFQRQLGDLGRQDEIVLR